MSDWTLTRDEEDVIAEAVAYNTYPYTAKVVRARKSHRCVVSRDVSWARACHSVRPGERYVVVTVFAAPRPARAAVCSACAEGCALPDAYEESSDD